MSEVMTATLMRMQFQAFEQLCSEMALTDHGQRLALQLSPAAWDMWLRARAGAPLSASDQSFMLLRMGRAAHRLSIFAERRRTN